MYEQLDLFEISNQTKDEEKEEGLTERQKALYNLIYHNSMVEHRKTTQEEIVSKLAIYGYQWTESENTSDHCSTIWSDVAALNLSFENDNVIITKNYIYWIGSKKETEAFLRKLWKDLSPRLTRYWAYAKKIAKDGQGDILAEKFHKSFNDYDVEMQKAIEENKLSDKELNAQGEQK